MAATHRLSGHARPWIATAAILLGATVFVAALAAGVLAAADHIDRASRAREARLVDNGIQIQAEELRRSAVANTIWDDALQHLDTRFDPAWARDFIGQYFWRNDRYELIYVLDAQGRPAFAYESGHVLPPTSYGPLAAQVAPLVAAIRARERARRPFNAKDAEPSKPIDAGAVVRRDGRAYILSASLVQTDHGGKAVPSAAAPIVVLADAVDAALLAKLTRRYLLDGLRVLPAGATPARGENHTQLTTRSGDVAAVLAWRPDSPVVHLLGVVGPPLAIAILALGVGAALLLAHERRRNLILEAATRDARLASDAKSAFLATMSHEIRTPLNGMLGMAQAMAKDRSGAHQAERLEVIRSSGEVLLGLLNDILDLSKIESGKLSLEVMAFDLGALMLDIRNAFATLAATKGLEFSLALEGAEGVYRGDPTRIRQILFNLASNAMKFTEAGRIALTAARDGERLIFSVEDTGVGIPADRQEAIFGAFSQADSSTTRRFGGTGLGLSICRDLATLMGGTIAVTSEPGRGSRFTVELPLERVGDALAARVEPAIPDSPDGGPPLRILAAEDNAVNQLVLKTLLADTGVALTVVGDGRQAVAAWAPGAWDLILMDVQMPVMDGVDATRAIRAAEAGAGAARTPIYALTANALAHQHAEYEEAGMDGRIAKPIDIHRLFEVIAAVSRPAGKASAAA